MHEKLLDVPGDGVNLVRRDRVGRRRIRLGSFSCRLDLRGATEDAKHGVANAIEARGLFDILACADAWNLLFVVRQEVQRVDRDVADGVSHLSEKLFLAAANALFDFQMSMAQLAGLFADAKDHTTVLLLPEVPHLPFVQLLLEFHHCLWVEIEIVHYPSSFFIRAASRVMMAVTEARSLSEFSWCFSSRSVTAGA